MLWGGDSQLSVFFACISVLLKLIDRLCSGVLSFLCVCGGGCWFVVSFVCLAFVFVFGVVGVGCWSFVLVDWLCLCKGGECCACVAGFFVVCWLVWLSIFKCCADGCRFAGLLYLVVWLVYVRSSVREGWYGLCIRLARS